MPSHFPLSVNSLRSGRSLLWGISESVVRHKARRLPLILALLDSGPLPVEQQYRLETNHFLLTERFPSTSKTPEDTARHQQSAERKKNDREPKRHKDKEGKCENLAFGSHVYGPQGKRPSTHWAPSACSTWRGSPHIPCQVLMGSGFVIVSERERTPSLCLACLKSAFPSSPQDEAS